MKTVSLDMFFDTDLIKQAADPATHKALPEAGAAA